MMTVHQLYRGSLARPLPAAVLQLGAIAVVGGVSLASPDQPGVPGGLAAVLAGLIAWSLFEYGLHRVLMHSRNRRLWELLHQEHHQTRQLADPSHRLLHPAVPILLFVPAALLGGASAAWALGVTGFWAGYLAYELIHWTHHHPVLAERLNRFAYFERRLRFHYDHHFRHPRANYGFTSALWDHVFRSYVEPAPLSARRGGGRREEAAPARERLAA